MASDPILKVYDIIGSTNFFDEVNLCIGLELELAAAIDEGQIL